MDNKTILLIICMVFFPLFSDPSFLAHADGDHKRKRERNHESDDRDSTIKQVKNSVYQAECGACHFAYQPEFLPESSWMKLLSTLDDHFGESVELDADSEKTITDYLKSSSADHSTAKRAGKIIKELGDQVPMRITQTPYIKKAHHEISQAVLNRASIGSLSNCIACHTTAEDGIYDDDNVKIPQ